MVNFESAKRDIINYSNDQGQVDNKKVIEAIQDLSDPWAEDNLSQLPKDVLLKTLDKLAASPQKGLENDELFARGLIGKALSKSQINLPVADKVRLIVGHPAVYNVMPTVAAEVDRYLSEKINNMKKPWFGRFNIEKALPPQERELLTLNHLPALLDKLRVLDPSAIKPLVTSIAAHMVQKSDPATRVDILIFLEKNGFWNIRDIISDACKEPGSRGKFQDDLVRMFYQTYDKRIAGLLLSSLLVTNFHIPKDPLNLAIDLWNRREEFSKEFAGNATLQLILLLNALPGIGSWTGLFIDEIHTNIPEPYKSLSPSEQMLQLLHEKIDNKSLAKKHLLDTNSFWYHFIKDLDPKVQCEILMKMWGQTDMNAPLPSDIARVYLKKKEANPSWNSLLPDEKTKT